MFMVYDKDAGTFVDLREIMDFTEDDFQDNKEVAGILKQMNESNPVQQLPMMNSKFDENEMSVSQNYYITNTKPSSFPIKSQLDQTSSKSEDIKKSMAIMQNRNTQYSTLNLP